MSQTNMPSLLPQKIAFVDTETTGMRVNYDRVIEIGVLRIEEDKLVKSFETLLDPGGYISPEITTLTGITALDLESAPSFRQVSSELEEILNACIFVAHNVRFDYAFLKQEFKRLGKSFSPKHFCTVKLAKKLFPNLRGYNLDSIIENFEIECKRRHRAFDDAKVLWDFYQIAQKSVSEDLFLEKINLCLKRPSLPIKITQKNFDALPETPGVYIFYGDKGAPLYIGKSINIRERVLSHFSSDHSSSVEMKISQQIASIEAIQTVGELGALLLESSLIKKHQPLYNKVLRRKRQLVILKQIKSPEGFETITMEVSSSIDPTDINKVLGVFRSVRNAKDFLISMAKKHLLCEKLLGLEKTTKACFGYRLGRCNGACVKKESLLKYNIRFLTAFAGSKFQSWPFEGPILVEEKNELDEKKEIFVIDQWCFLGSIKKSSDALDEMLNQEYSFDLDTYKILHRFFKSEKNIKTVRQIKPSSLHPKYRNHSFLNSINS